MTDPKPDTDSGSRTGEAPSRRRKSETRAPFKLAGHVVEAGERLQFTLPAVNFFTNTPLDMSIEVVHGKRSGPVLLVCAAIHGDELNGVEIIRRMRSFRSLASLRGTLIMVPVVIVAFPARSAARSLQGLPICFSSRSSGTARTS